jgi:hypothetical protein
MVGDGINSYQKMSFIHSFIQIDLPKCDLVLAHHDDTAVYDDGSKTPQDFKDDPR